VINKDTQKALEGVIVVAHWPLDAGDHQQQLAELKILESVSDKEGKVYFPAWGPEYVQRGNLTYKDPELLFYKDGYRYRRVSNRYTNQVSYASLRNSDWNGKTIALESFIGEPEKYAIHLHRLVKRLHFVYDGKPCDWKNAPLVVAALESKRQFFVDHQIYDSPKSVKELEGVCGASSR